MNPFERHGIKRLSPSSLNLWKAEPALWAMKYLMGHKDEAGPAAKRGVAVEAGVDAYLYGQRDLAACTKIALHNFELNTGGQCDDEHDDERAAIPSMLEQATAALKDAPPVTGRQVSIETWLDGIDVPIIGFCDWVFEDGTIVDLKTTHRMPSEPKVDHMRQVAIYAQARQAPVSLLYVTTKKFARRHVDDDAVKAALTDMRRIALSMRSVLAAADTARDVANFTAPDYSSFYWSNDELKTKAKEIWI